MLGSSTSGQRERHSSVESIVLPKGRSPVLAGPGKARWDAKGGLGCGVPKPNMDRGRVHGNGCSGQQSGKINGFYSG